MHCHRLFSSVTPPKGVLRYPLERASYYSKSQINQSSSGMGKIRNLERRDGTLGAAELGVRQNVHRLEEIPYAILRSMTRMGVGQGTMS